MTTEHTDHPHASDVDVGDEGPTLVVEDIERVDFAKYAGASGDFNPLHVDEPHAKEAGNPSVFGHGMLTAGYAARMVANWFGLANVKQFKTRFTSKLWPGDTLTVTGKIVEKYDSDGSVFVDIEIEATNQEDDPIIMGSATAVVPSE